MKIILSEKDKTLFRQIWEAFYKWVFGLAMGVFIGISWGMYIWRD